MSSGHFGFGVVGSVVLLSSLGAGLVDCAGAPPPPPKADVAAPAGSAKPASSVATPAAPTSPLLVPWTGPHGGVPPFGRFTVADFKPALEAGMVENLAEIDRIAANPAAPTFDNTI